ncbi:hypothetical protein DW322_03225 [Rhodococcus rhodnii]|nr:hypothetical protein [Rhodococcus rhodnii]TXG89427.1 hypothetical protein DW322_03225 [Rhodococcus rhodnii]
MNIRSTGRVRVLAFAATTAAALVLSGCSSDGATEAGADPAASSEFQDASSPREKLLAAMKVTNSLDPVRLDTEANGAHITGQISREEGVQYMRTGVPGAGEQETLVIGDDTLMRYSDVPEGFPFTSGTWYRVDANSPLGMQSAQLAAASADPYASHAAVEDALVDVTETGTETIHGVETTHYVATLDLDAYVAASLQALGSEVDPAQIEQMKALMSPGASSGSTATAASSSRSCRAPRSR